MLLHPRLRLLLPVLALALILPLAASCESKKDVSLSTSPAILAMVGTTTGNVDYSPLDSPPAPKAAVSGWKVGLGQASWTKLENGFPAIMIVLNMNSKPGAGMEIWLAQQGGKSVAHWFGGSSTTYDGTACFRMTTQQNGVALDIKPTEKYNLTIDFIDPTTGIVASSTMPVAGNTPTITGRAPKSGDTVFSITYACAKGD